MTEEATGLRHTPGTPCRASLMVRDLPGSRDFYQALFGWEFRAGPQQPGPYVRAVLDGREVAALGETAPGRESRIAWIPYLASDDADATADRIRACGGTVAVGPLDSGQAGRMAIAADPAGASFGVWQAGTHLGPGAGEADRAGTPVWFELLAARTSAVARFYPAVFGYDVAETGGEDEDELTLRLAGHVVAGVRGVGDTLPAGHPPYWETCFAVADAEAAVHRVTELGGRLVQEPRETPYGRRATVLDPEGARFSVLTRDAAAH